MTHMARTDVEVHAAAVADTVLYSIAVTERRGNHDPEAGWLNHDSTTTHYRAHTALEAAGRVYDALMATHGPETREAVMVYPGTNTPVLSEPVERLARALGVD